MENKLMIFENDAFGKVRTLNLNGERMCAKRWNWGIRA